MDNSIIDWTDPNHDRFKEVPKLFRGDILMLAPSVEISGYKVVSAEMKNNKFICKAIPSGYSISGLKRITFGYEPKSHAWKYSNIEYRKYNPAIVIEIYEKKEVADAHSIFSNGQLLNELNDLKIIDALLLFDMEAGLYLIKDCLSDLHSFKTLFSSVHRNGQNIL